ncbi:MAG: ATP-binding protein [Bacteroidetes bacterium]|nr:ATP-binding protein [Bacteroidota bacterium]MDF1865730.1 ATP-binding protein [Saprospiraceae bacterium]
MFKSFRVIITLRILFIIALVLALVYCFSYTEYYITMFILVVVIVLTVGDMIHKVNQSNRDFTAFLLGIKYEDFSATYSGHHKGKTFGEMYDAFNQINRKFLNIKAEKEANHQYLQTIVEHVSVGLLCLDEEGNVFMMNKALKKLLRKPYLVNAEALKKIDKNLYEVVQRLHSGDKELLKITIDNKIVQLSISALEFKLQKQSLKLVSMQNIQSELEERELEAWQKLIRILRHEIMNSISPIVSLTSTIEGMMKGGKLEGEDLDDVKAAIRAIRNRSEGLMHFTETYRNLTRIPPPKFQIVDVRLLVQRLSTLLKPAFEKDHINFQMQMPNSPVNCSIDPELLEQVLINLIKNAIEAVNGSEKPTITVTAQKEQSGKTTISVIDNGKGIEEGELDEIFVPFYTTKVEGTGIGLSLSRQIVRMHKGRLFVQSVVGEGTVFTIVI